jgi:hypothetical protein
MKRPRNDVAFMKFARGRAQDVAGEGRQIGGTDDAGESTGDRRCHGRGGSESSDDNPKAEGGDPHIQTLLL